MYLTNNPVSITGKKWVGGNRDASTIVSARRYSAFQSQAVQNIALNKTSNLNNTTIGGFNKALKGLATSFDNSAMDARQRVRRGSSGIPKKTSYRPVISSEAEVIVPKWYLYGNSKDWRSIVCGSTGKYIIAGSTSGNNDAHIIISKNYGITYNNSISGITATTMMACNESSSIIIGGNSVSGKTLLTLDGGIIWKTLLFGGSVVACGRDTGTTMITGSSYGVFYSKNSGGTWYLSNIPSYTWSDAACDSTGQYIILVSVNGGIWKSDDYGAIWVHINSEVIAWSSVCCNSTCNHIVACENTGSIYESIDGGINWYILPGLGMSTWNRVRCDKYMTTLVLSTTVGLYISTYPFLTKTLQIIPGVSNSHEISDAMPNIDASIIVASIPNKGLCTFR
jgi:hypothetical protein